MENEPAVAISVRGLTKYYGEHLGVEDVTFDVHAGEVVGFLGPNGSGKTTVLRMLTGLIGITRGTADILGHRLGPGVNDVRADIGYLPGTLELYKNLTAGEYLSFMARMRGIDDATSFTDLADRFELPLGNPISGLSKGTKQKVGVVQAFMHRPRVLLLDEPTSGLDPLVQREFESLLAEVRDDGAAVLLSSHVMAEVDQMASKVAVLDHGHLIAVDSVEELKNRTAHKMAFHFETVPDVSRFRSCKGVTSADLHGHKVECTVVGPQTDVLSLAAGLGAIEVISHEPTLEEVFFSLTENNRVA